MRKFFGLGKGPKKLQGHTQPIATPQRDKHARQRKVNKVNTRRRGGNR